MPCESSLRTSGAGSSSSARIGSATSSSTASANASQAASNCLGKRSTASRSSSATCGRASAMRAPGSQRNGVALAPELLPHRVGGAQHAAVLLAGDRRVGVEQPVGDVAPHDPPGVALVLGRHHRRVDRGGHALKQALGVEQPFPPQVARVARDPVRRRVDPLCDKCPPVGGAQTVEPIARPACRYQRPALGHAESLEQRRRLGSGELGRGRARWRPEHPMPGDCAVAKLQVLALAGWRSRPGPPAPTTRRSRWDRAADANSASRPCPRHRRSSRAAIASAPRRSERSPCTLRSSSASSAWAAASGRVSPLWSASRSSSAMAWPACAALTVAARWRASPTPAARCRSHCGRAPRPFSRAARMRRRTGSGCRSIRAAVRTLPASIPSQSSSVSAT